MALTRKPMRSIKQRTAKISRMSNLAISKYSALAHKIFGRNFLPLESKYAAYYFFFVLRFTQHWRTLQMHNKRQVLENNAG